MYKLHILSNDQLEINETPITEFSNTSPQLRMIQNITTLQNIMAMTWENKILKLFYLPIFLNFYIQEVFFTVSATINEIDDTFGCHYIECEKCMKKLKQEGHELKFPSCETPSKYPKPRLDIFNHKSSYQNDIFNHKSSYQNYY